jgi:hypothetical protein
MFGWVKSVWQSSRNTGPSTTHDMSDRRATSFAGIRICMQWRLASAIIAPYSAFWFLAGESYRAQFSVGTGIALANHGIGRAHEPLTRLCMHDQRAERRGPGGIHGPRGELNKLPHPLFMNSGHTNTSSSRGRHGAI